MSSRRSHQPPWGRAPPGAYWIRSGLLASSPDRGLDAPVFHAAVHEGRHDGPLALPALHLRAREDVQPARVVTIRIGQRLLLDHRVVLVDRILERVRVEHDLAVVELGVLAHAWDLRQVRMPGVGTDAV